MIKPLIIRILNSIFIKRQILFIIFRSFKFYSEEMRFFIKNKSINLSRPLSEYDNKSVYIRKLAHVLERLLFEPFAYSSNSGETFSKTLEKLLLYSDESVSIKLKIWANRILREYKEKRSKETFCPILIDNITSPKSLINTDSLMMLIRQRRSRRIFLDVPLTDLEKNNITEAAQYAPSSCNRQTLDLIFVEDPELKQFVSSTIPGGYQFFHKAPCIMVLTSYIRDYRFPEDRVAPFVDGAAAIQNIYLVCETIGLGCCWGSYTSFGNIYCEPEVRKKLRIPDSHFIVGSLAIGKSDQFICHIPRDEPSTRYGTNYFRNKNYTSD